MIGAFVAAALTGASIATPCELHLFALSLGSGTQPKGTTLVKVLSGSDDPLAFINVMSPRARMDQVDDDTYRRTLNLADGQPIVRHWDVPVDASIRKKPGPLVATPGRCHVELTGYYAMGMAADRSRLGKNEFLVNLLLREFAPDGSVVLKVDKSGYGAVDAEKKVGRDEALKSLQTASVTMIEDFGKKVAKKRDKDLAKNEEGQ
jgi:hypothetical protein